VICMNWFCFTLEALKTDKQAPTKALLYQALVWNRRRCCHSSLISTYWLYPTVCWNGVGIVQLLHIISCSWNGHTHISWSRDFYLPSNWVNWSNSMENNPLLQKLLVHPHNQEISHLFSTKSFIALFWTACHQPLPWARYI
jgi:hypothetical protein